MIASVGILKFINWLLDKPDKLFKQISYICALYDGMMCFVVTF